MSAKLGTRLGTKLGTSPPSKHLGRIQYLAFNPLLDQQHASFRPGRRHRKILLSSPAGFLILLVPGNVLSDSLRLRLSNGPIPSAHFEPISGPF